MQSVTSKISTGREAVHLVICFSCSQIAREWVIFSSVSQLIFQSEYVTVTDKIGHTSVRPSKCNPSPAKFQPVVKLVTASPRIVDDLWTIRSNISQINNQSTNRRRFVDYLVKHLTNQQPVHDFLMICGLSGQTSHKSTASPRIVGDLWTIWSTISQINSQSTNRRRFVDYPVKHLTNQQPVHESSTICGLSGQRSHKSTASPRIFDELWTIRSNISQINSQSTNRRRFVD